MQLTLRLEDDNYLDLNIDISKREIYFLSPIPNLSLERLMELSDQLHWSIVLPITEQIIEPEVTNLPTEEIKEYYTPDTETAITLLLGLCNMMVSE